MVPFLYKLTVASKGFPNVYSKRVCVCVRLHSDNSEPTCFLRRRLTNTPRRPRLADGQLISPRQVSARLAPRL